jgi:hypothetical protein
LLAFLARLDASLEKRKHHAPRSSHNHFDLHGLRKSM